MTRTTKVPQVVGAVTPDFAFKLLCTLGESTTLPDLYKVLVARFGLAGSPGMATLGAWSRQFKWPERRAQFQAKVNDRVEAIIEDEQVAYKVDQIKSLTGIAEKAFDIANCMLTGGMTAEGNAIAQVAIKNNLVELQKVLDVGLKASQQLQLLRGQPTAISEQRQLMRDVDDSILIKRLERKGKLINGHAEEVDADQ